MEVTKIYCDICQSEVVDSSCLSQVEIAITPRCGYRGCRDKIYAKRCVCDDCLGELGIKPQSNSVDLRDNQRTLSDMFRDIEIKITQWLNI
jgi:hypothetical protein